MVVSSVFPFFAAIARVVVWDEEPALIGCVSVVDDDVDGTAGVGSTVGIVVRVGSFVLLATLFRCEKNCGRCCCCCVWCCGCCCVLWRFRIRGLFIT